MCCTEVGKVCVKRKIVLFELYGCATYKHIRNKPIVDGFEANLFCQLAAANDKSWACIVGILVFLYGSPLFKVPRNNELEIPGALFP